MADDDQADSTTETEAQVLARITTRADELWSWWQVNITESEIDRNMQAGQQWPDAIRDLRKNRITLTVNKLSQFIERILGDLRQNPASIKYRAKTFNDGSKVKGAVAGKEYSIAEVREAVVKDIEDRSNAEMWYDRAASQMVGGALGYLRLDARTGDYGKTCLEISGVINPSLTLIDYAGVMPDYSDARDGFIFTPIPVKVFKKAYPNTPAQDFSYPSGYQGMRWVREDSIMVAEYWEVIETEDYQKKVVWRRLCGNSILDGGEEGLETPFRQVPIIPMLGREVTTADGYRIYESAHRHARDAMRDSNYWRSAMTEMIALQPKQPWVSTKAMIQNNQTVWENANITQPSVLTFEADPDFPGQRPQRERPADVPVAIMQIYQTCMNDLREAIGMYSQSSGNIRGDESGRAILAKERQDDTGLYVFTQSRDRAIRRVGVLIQQALPKMYQEQQTIRMLAEDGTVDFVTVNQQVVQPDGSVMVINDMTAGGEFECYVDAGPSYATQRIEAVNTLTDLAKAMPEAMSVAADKIIDNLDIPGAREISTRIKRSMNPALLSPNELEELQKGRENMPPPPPDPNLQLQAAIEEAKSVQKEAQVAIEQIKAREKELELMIEQQSAANNEQVRDAVAEALAEFIAQSQQKALPPQAT